MRGSSLDLATLVQLDGVALEIISQSTEDGIVVAVPERDPGIGVLTASNDAGAHSIRVVFGPAPARLLPGSNPTARWTAVAGASGYALWLGTGAGRSDLFEQRFTTALESDVPRLDAGRVYWRLWTLFDGEWSYRDLVTEIRLAANRPISTQSGSPMPW